ncbi:MAG: TolC family protein [Bdellovibrionota bacterium]
MISFRVAALVALLIPASLVHAAGLPVDMEVVFTRLKQLSIEKSPDIQIAASTADQKAAEVWTSFARWAPGLTFQTSYVDALNNSFLTSGALGSSTIIGNITPKATALFSWGLNLNFPIFKRSVELGMEQAFAGKNQAGAQLDSRLHELDWHLRQLLGAYLVQIYREETLKKSIEIAQTNLRDAKLRFELGTNTKVDVLRTDANLVSLESKKVTFYQQRIAAQADLLEYSGLSQEELASLGLAEPFSDEAGILHAIDQFTAYEQTLKSLTTYLGADPIGEEVRNRKIVDSSPNYRNYLAQEDLSSIQAKTLSAQDWPDLSLQASANNQNSDISQAFNNGSTTSWSFGIYVNVPLNIAGSIVSSSLQTARGAHVAEIQRMKDVRHFKNEIENDRIRIEALAKSLESLKLTVAQTEEIARLSEKSYKLGKATIVELLGSENDLTDAKINLAQTKVDLSVLVRKMAWNLGVIAE